MGQLTIWGRANSVNVQKVLWALEELDVPYTRENIGGSFGGSLGSNAGLKLCGLAGCSLGFFGLLPFGAAGVNSQGKSGASNSIPHR